MPPLMQLMQAYVLHLVQTSRTSLGLDPNPRSLDVHCLGAVGSYSLCSTTACAVLQLVQYYSLCRRLERLGDLLDPNPRSLDVHYLCAVESCSLCRLN